MVPLFCLIFLFTCDISLQCKLASNVEKNDQFINFTHLESVTNRNYTIKVILTFTDPESSCKKVSLDSLLTSYAIKQAIDIANNNTQSGKINVQFNDNCGNLSVTMALGIQIVSTVKMTSDCNDKYLQCSANENFIQPPAAILGTDMSKTTVSLATLMSLFKIPVLSPWASSRLLSDTKMYSSFIRVIPSDSMQVQVMLDIMMKLNWTYIFAVGSNDPYGKLALAELEIEAKSRNICIVNTSFVTYPAEEFNDEINKTIDKIKIASNATVVVIAHRENISRIWLTSDAWNNEAKNKKHDVPINQMHGLLSVSLKFTKIFGLSDYIRNEIKTNYLFDVWLQNYLINEFNCKPNKISINKLILFGDNCSVSVDHVMLKVSESVVTSNWIDAVTVLANGIQYYDKNCYDERRKNSPIDYEKLTYIIKTIPSYNYNGNLISFNNSNDLLPAFYTIENLQYDEKNGTLNYISIGLLLFFASKSLLEKPLDTAKNLLDFLNIEGGIVSLKHPNFVLRITQFLQICSEKDEHDLTSAESVEFFSVTYAIAVHTDSESEDDSRGEGSYQLFAKNEEDLMNHGGKDTRNPDPSDDSDGKNEERVEDLPIPAVF
nr:metabotropic glutamate receptor 4-like [Hydra vulgaris]